MSVVTLNREFLTAKLNSVKPHSRLRPGIVAILQELNRRELEEERITRECVSALEEAFADESGDFRRRIRETY